MSKTNYRTVEDLIAKLSLHNNKVETTKELTKFYANAKIRISTDEFSRQYTDGSNDGGIDFYHRDNNTFYIFQTKFSENPKKVNAQEIIDEIRKIQNTLTSENPNKKAEDFVNGLKREIENKEAIVEIVWLTTNIVNPSVIDEIKQYLNVWRKEKKWLCGLDFNAIDKHALDSVIYDVEHGYVPYTGKKNLKLETGQWIETTWEDTGVYSIVCTVNINDVLKWFADSAEIEAFLQKNVREFLGEKSKINRAVGRSYFEDPKWFWYKHNGIIVFADNLHVDKAKMELLLSNPQIVNGGQTLKTLFGVYDKHKRDDNYAKVLVRAYRLPYANTDTYKKSIEIISALNSQNPIKPSDLKSTDQRQVRLERLFRELGYKYFRKRSKEARPGSNRITMRDLALRYYVCKKNCPNEGIRNAIEELFSEDSKYNETFNESEINKDLNGNHIALKYITCWRIDQLLSGDVRGKLPERDKKYFKHLRWFVLADIYKKVDEKRKEFSSDWRTWHEFVKSYRFSDLILNYSRTYAFKIGKEIIPSDTEEPKKFFRTLEAVRKFDSKTKRHGTKFESLMGRAYNKFEKDSEM